MKKVMVVRSYGSNWDYNLYLVPDDIVSKAEKLMENGEWAKAYNLIRENDRNYKNNAYANL